MNILTFDIEEWFHLLDNEETENINNWTKFKHRAERMLIPLLDLLEEEKIKASFFCLGWLAELQPNIIKEIYSRGHEIGTHSHHHHLIYKQNEKSFKEDLHKSIGILEDIIGIKVKLYRSPGFSLNKDTFWAFDILINEGIEMDSSIFPSKRSHGGISDYKFNRPHIINYKGNVIKEFPISTSRILGKQMVITGGGYFRLFPYQIIKNAINKNPYNMTYFHLRDFDKDQPILKNLSLYRKFKSYYGIKNAFSKFSRLIKNFDFVSIESVNKIINWENAEIFLIK